MVTNSSSTTPPTVTQQPSLKQAPGVASITNNLTNSNNNSTLPTAVTQNCVNPASEINARLDTQVEVRVYPCTNNSNNGNKKKFTQFNVKPEVSADKYISRAV